MNLNVDTDDVKEKLTNFKNLVQQTKATVPGDLLFGIDKAVGFLGLTTKDPISFANAIEFLRPAVGSISSRGVIKPDTLTPEQNAMFEPTRSAAERALRQLEAAVASSLASYYEVQGRFARSKIVDKIGGGKALIFSAVLLGAIIIIGAGIPIIISYIKNKQKSTKDKNTLLTENVNSNVGFEINDSSTLVSGAYTMTNLQSQFVTNGGNQTCTYTVLMNINSLVDTGDLQILLARGNSTSNTSNATVPQQQNVQLQNSVMRVVLILPSTTCMSSLRQTILKNRTVCSL